jgi:hypothetical protein
VWRLVVAVAEEAAAHNYNRRFLLHNHESYCYQQVLPVLQPNQSKANFKSLVIKDHLKLFEAS